MIAINHLPVTPISHLFFTYLPSYLPILVLTYLLCTSSNIQTSMSFLYLTPKASHPTYLHCTFSNTQTIFLSLLLPLRFSPFPCPSPFLSLSCPSPPFSPSLPRLALSSCCPLLFAYCPSSLKFFSLIPFPSLIDVFFFFTLNCDLPFPIPSSPNPFPLQP